MIGTVIEILPGGAFGNQRIGTQDREQAFELQVEADVAAGVGELVDLDGQMVRAVDQIVGGDHDLDLSVFGALCGRKHLVGDRAGPHVAGAVDFLPV